MTEEQFIEEYSRNTLASKLSLEKEGATVLYEYFNSVLLFIEDSIMAGNTNIIINQSIIAALQIHASICVQRMYRGHNLSEFDKARLNALLSSTLNRRISDNTNIIDAYTNRQIAVALSRAMDALDPPYRKQQLLSLILQHLKPIWERRAKNMAVSETQANVETIANVGNSSAEEQARIYTLFGDDDNLERQLRSSTVFSYLLLADELPEKTPLQRLDILAKSNKMWITMEDEKVRPTHAAVHRNVVRKDAFFVVGGYPMLHPGDPSAPPKEVINCRCVMVYL